MFWTKKDASFPWEAGKKEKEKIFLTSAGLFTLFNATSEPSYCSPHSFLHWNGSKWKPALHASLGEIQVHRGSQILPCGLAAILDFSNSVSTPMEIRIIDLNRDPESGEQISVLTSTAWLDRDQLSLVCHPSEALLAVSVEGQFCELWDARNGLLLGRMDLEDGDWVQCFGPDRTIWMTRSDETRGSLLLQIDPLTEKTLEEIEDISDTMSPRLRGSPLGKSVMIGQHEFNSISIRRLSNLETPLNLSEMSSLLGLGWISEELVAYGIHDYTETQGGTIQIRGLDWNSSSAVSLKTVQLKPQEYCTEVHLDPVDSKRFLAVTEGPQGIRFHFVEI